MATTSTPPEMKSRDAETVIELDRLGFKYRYEPEFPVARISSTERHVQVREDDTAPKDLVKEMAVQMGTTPFPAIVMSQDDYLVNGNTRYEARKLRKDPFMPALVILEDYATASEKRKLEFKALAYTLNGETSKQLTAKERKNGVIDLLKLNWNGENIARVLGIGSATVGTIKREMEAKRRLTMMGIEVNGNIAPASLRALGNADVIKLNDPAFRGLTELAGDTGFNAKEIVEAGKVLRDCGSDEAAVEWLQQIRDENEGRIRERKLTGNGRPPVARQLRQRLGFITKYEGQEVDLVERNQAAAVEHRAVLAKSVTILNEVLRQQNEWLAAHQEEGQS